MITVIYGHPYGKSFNAAIKDAVLAALAKQGPEWSLIDLYADRFDPAVRAPELALYCEGRTSDPVAQKYMDILARTERIVYIFPVWWGTEPAIVKGFHDKVLLKGFAWTYSADGRLQPRLKITRTTLLTTSEAPTATFSAYFTDYLPGHVFAAVGMQGVSWHNFDNIPRSTPEERAAFLELAARVAVRP